MTRLFMSAALAVALAVSFAAPQFAQAQKKDDPVLARVNGKEIRQSDVDLADADIGQSLPGVTGDARRDALVSYLIDVSILAQAASAKKLDAAPDFAGRLAYARNKVLMESLLNDITKTAATEAEMKKLYDESVAKLTPEEEVHARHILVEDEAKAKDVLAKLRAGGDFEKLAKELSKDPGGQNGGDLGYFSKEQMVKEFADAAFKLEKGQLSEPVKSQFGFHIIRVEDKRSKPVPTYEQVKDQVAAFVVRKAQAELVMKLRADAKIENLVKKEEPAPAPAPAAPPAKDQKKK